MKMGPPSSLHCAGFWFNTVVTVLTLCFDIFVAVRYWALLTATMVSFLIFWIGLIFIIFPYMRYAQIYRRLREFRELTTTWSEEQTSVFSQAVGSVRSELDILMSCYLAAVLGLVLCAIHFMRHKY